jgi:hypothetical protein
LLLRKAETATRAAPSMVVVNFHGSLALLTRWGDSPSFSV